MIRCKRYFFLGFIIFIFISSFFIYPALASSAKVTPVSFLHRTADIVVSRVADIIYYLIMQKRYIFDDFTDPNTYSSLSIPSDLEQILSSTTASTSIAGKEKQSKLEAPSSSSLPVIKKTAPAPVKEKQTPIVYSTPVLVVKSSSVSVPVSVIEPALDFNTDSDILLYTNKERQKFGLPDLVASRDLNNIAALRADDLFTNQYFEHDSPDGKSAPDLAKKINYDYLLIGENLAQGHFDGDKEIVSAWMDSPGHRANILNEKYTELGTVVRQGVLNGNNTTIAVQIFARALTNCPRPNSDKKVLIDTSTVSIKKMQTEALVMYENLTVLKDNPAVERSYYQQKIQEYNYFAKKVNEAITALKTMIDVYNTEVARYNSCINN